MRESMKDVCGKARIVPGDMVFMHGDSMVATEFSGLTLQEKLKNFYAEFLEYLGPNGTLIVPNFTYAFTRGLDFDVYNSVSEIGTFSEVFRLMEQSSRSWHPIFSVSAIGKSAKLFEHTNVDHCFGPGSSFDLMHRLNGKIVCIGTSINAMTYVHYVEQALNVDYRYSKSFSGKIICGATSISQSTDYFVRDYDFDTTTNLSGLKERLIARNKYHASAFGRVRIVSVSARDFFEESELLLSNNPLGLINQCYVGTSNWIKSE